MLADNESEKSKWVIALGELHRILKRNNLPNTDIYKVNEILDNTLSIIRNALCSVITYTNQILLGTEDGLFYINLDQYGKLFSYSLSLFMLIQKSFRKDSNFKGYIGENFQFRLIYFDL